MRVRMLRKIAMKSRIRNFHMCNLMCDAGGSVTRKDPTHSSVSFIVPRNHWHHTCNAQKVSCGCCSQLTTWYRSAVHGSIWFYCISTRVTMWKNPMMSTNVHNSHVSFTCCNPVRCFQDKTQILELCTNVAAKEGRHGPAEARVKSSHIWLLCIPLYLGLINLSSHLFPL